MTNTLDSLIANQMTGMTDEGRADAVRKELAAQIKQAAISMPIQLAAQLNDVLRAFWNSDDPQKLADELDKETPGFTAQLFQYHYELATFLVGKVPSLANVMVGRPNTYEVSINQTTGTVTITKKVE